MIYRYAAKPLILALADLFDYIRIGGFGRYVKPFGGVAAFFRHAAEKIDHGIGEVVLATEKGAVALWHGLAYQARVLGRVLGDLAETIEHRFHGLLFAFPPAVALWAAVRAAHALRGLPDLVRYVYRAVTVTLPRRITRGEALAREALRRLGVGIDRLRGELKRALVVGIAAIGARVGRLERRGDQVWSRIRRLDKTVAAVGAAALVTTALARLGLGWLRCPRVGKLGRRACGMDADLLEDLILGTVAIVGTISLVETIRDMQSIMEPSVDFTRQLIREL